MTKPIRYLQKTDGNVRLVSNLTKLNDIVRKDTQSIPSMRDVIRATEGNDWFTVIDLKTAFHYIEIAENDKTKTVFEFRRNTYEWSGMVMGFENSPMIMQRAMNKIFFDMTEKNVMVYMDDIVVFNKDLCEHIKTVEKVIMRLCKEKLRISPKKTQYCKNEIKLLGMMIDGKERMPLEEKQKTIRDAEIPKNVSKLRSFLGKIGWLRNFIPNCADKIKNMTDGLKTKNKNLIWTPEMDKEFQGIKDEVK